MNCPKCDSPILAESINIQANVAVCNNCNQVFAPSEVLHSSNLKMEFDLDHPPKGTWYIDNMDKVIFGAHTRSPVAFFLVPFTMVWAGGSLSGIYGSQIMEGNFDPILSLFGIPFLIGSIFLISISIMLTAGKIELTADRDGVQIYTGALGIGYGKNFSWFNIQQIDEKQVRNKNGYSWQIEIIELNKFAFGSMVNDEKRQFLYFTLKKLFDKYKNKKHLI